jgi:hypothetical protein
VLEAETARLVEGLWLGRHASSHDDHANSPDCECR